MTEHNTGGTNFINPPTIHTPSGYTHVVETSGRRQIFLSGQVALSPDGQIVGLDDAKLQAEQVFANLAAGLAAAGATFDNVVKMTYFMVDMADFPAVREVRDRFVNTAQPPASTAVKISGLVFDWGKLEIEAIAVVD